MNNILIITDPLKININNLSNYNIIIGLDETINNIVPHLLCLIPNREIKPHIANAYILFIPFSRDNDWNYKQQARALRYKLGGERCLIVGTDFSYPLHKKVNLSYEEELDILLLTIEYYLQNNCQVTISSKIDLRSDKQNQYLEELINNEKIKVLNE